MTMEGIEKLFKEDYVLQDLDLLYFMYKVLFSCIKLKNSNIKVDQKTIEILLISELWYLEKIENHSDHDKDKYSALLNKLQFAVEDGLKNPWGELCASHIGHPARLKNFESDPTAKENMRILGEFYYDSCLIHYHLTNQ